MEVDQYDSAIVLISFYCSKLFLKAVTKLLMESPPNIRDKTLAESKGGKTLEEPKEKHKTLISNPNEFTTPP